MSGVFEKADEAIKKLAGAPMKPVFRPVDYAFHYGQLSGAIILLANRYEHLEDSDLRAEIARLVKLQKEIHELTTAQHEQNIEALKL